MALTALPTVRFARGRLRVIDQTLLPARYEIRELATVDAVCDAIRRLCVRGAPAIGVAGAYGLLVAIEERWGADAFVFDSGVDDDGVAARVPRARAITANVAAIEALLADAAVQIGATRPTAVNLNWALTRMRRVFAGAPGEGLSALVREADAILTEDIAMGRAMAAAGAALLADGDSVLTHCNTGGLAAGGVGTALATVFAAAADGKRIHVYADETRPLLQGARLTAWECVQRGVPVTVLVDGAAASLLATGSVRAVLVGADRIAANGDTANKIGTLSLAILAHRFGVPFHVVAPSSTIDTALVDGAGIPVEHRSADEVARVGATTLVAPGAGAYNPAFDVTPAELITAIVTERGVHRPPFHFGGGA